MVLAGILTLLWVVLGTAAAGPAAAHAELVSTAPANGAEVTRPPADLQLVFSEPVKPVKGSFDLRDEDDRRVAVVQPTAQAKTLRTPLPAGLGPGFYLFNFRVVSADNHPISGSVAFSVTKPAKAAAKATPKARPTAEPTAVAAAGGHSGHGGTAIGIPAVGTGVHAGHAEHAPLAGTAGVVRGISYAGAVLLLGVPAFALLCMPASRRDKRLWSAAALGAGLVVAAAAAALPVQAAQLAGTGIGGAFSEGRLSEVIDSRFGGAILWRLGLVAALVALLVVAARRPGRLPVVGAVLAAGGVALTYARIGHPGAGSRPELTMPADAIHLLAVAVWLAGLLVLASRVLPRPPADCAAVLARWSRVATVAVAVLVVTGVFQAAWRLRRFSALVDTEYGRWVLAKSIVLGGMLVLASLGRHKVRAMVIAAPPRALRAGASLGAALAEPRPDPDQIRLRRGVAFELALGGLVLILTAFLTATPPPA